MDNLYQATAEIAFEKLCKECEDIYVNQTQEALKKVRYFDEKGMKEEHRNAWEKCLEMVCLIFVVWFHRCSKKFFFL